MSHNTQIPSIKHDPVVGLKYPDTFHVLQFPVDVNMVAVVEVWAVVVAVVVVVFAGAQQQHPVVGHLVCLQTLWSLQGSICKPDF